VSYIGGYVVWNHLFAITEVPTGMGPTAGMSLLPLLGLFLVGYVVTYFYSLVKNVNMVMFSLIIWLLLVGTSTIPMVSIHTVPDAVLIASLVDHLFTSFIGVYVIGKVLTGTMHTVAH
jgi:hypothetical protein